MLRTLLVLLCCSRAANADPHHGAYKDPGHYVGPESYAGMRYIAEGSPHVLTMIGTDDGSMWWTLQGKCSGVGMATLTFDFSSKGGPGELVGKVVQTDSGDWTIVWPDGNAWVLMPTPAVPPASALKALEPAASSGPSSMVVLLLGIVLGVAAARTCTAARSPLAASDSAVDNEKF